MADAEEKAKAEKIAAARKRVEQMKKKKNKAGVQKEDRSEAAAESSKVDETPVTPGSPGTQADTTTSQDAIEGDAKDAANDEEFVSQNVADLKPTSHVRQPSISVQSKMRSSSFRQASGGPLSPAYGFSPEGETAPDIYRKQVLKIEELERENRRLAKEASDGEKRWKKAEEELEDLREAEDDLITKGKIGASVETSAELEKLNAEVVALQRQNTQLQAAASRSTKYGSSPIAQGAPADYEAILASKSSTIESMELEISNLHAQVERLSSGNSEKEQIAALEERLRRSEKAAANAQRELGDLKKNLDLTTSKAVKEGSERISAETKLRTLERETQEAKSHSVELQNKVDALEKKVATLATLHKEHDARSQAQKKERERAEKEVADLRSKLAAIENENARLKEERERARKRDAQGVDDEGVDDLEDEERQRLEKKVRDLEGEVHELRRGVWRDRRKELDGGDESSGVTSPGARFTDVDLSGGMSPGRRKSLAQGGRGIGDYITSGFNAITGAAPTIDDSLSEDDGDFEEFDEEAFRVAQQEEMTKRIERIKEVKRGLKSWEGWRLDILENRRGGGEGVGEIFEV